MKETLTGDTGLGNSSRCLCDSKLTFQGGESDLSSIKVELQPPRLMGSHGKLPVCFVRLVNEAEELLNTA